MARDIAGRRPAVDTVIASPLRRDDRPNEEAWLSRNIPIFAALGHHTRRGR
jgi:hypothetical protein